MYSGITDSFAPLKLKPCFAETKDHYPGYQLAFI